MKTTTESMTMGDQLTRITVDTTEAERNWCHLISGTPKLVKVIDADGCAHEVKLYRTSSSNGGQYRVCFYVTAQGQARTGMTPEEAFRALARTCGWPQSV